MNEPVRAVRDIVIHVRVTGRFPEVGTARPPSVGAVIQVRPSLSVVVALTPAEFDRVWSLAVASQLKHAYLALTKPRYRSALVTNVLFSNVPIE